MLYHLGYIFLYYHDIRKQWGFAFLILIDKQIAICQVLSSNGLRSAYFFNIISMQLKENDQLVFQAQHQCFEGKLKMKVKNCFCGKYQRGTESLQESSHLWAEGKCSN